MKNDKGRFEIPRVVESGDWRRERTARDHDNCFAALNIRHAIRHVGHRIENVRLAEPRNTQSRHCFLGFPLIGREICKDGRPHVKGDHSYVIVFLQCIEETVRSLKRFVPTVAPERLKAAAELGISNVEAHAAAWRPWRSYATHYLWEKSHG